MRHPITSSRDKLLRSKWKEGIGLIAFPKDERGVIRIFERLKDYKNKDNGLMPLILAGIKAGGISLKLSGWYRNNTFQKVLWEYF
jgi:hypothetical protein